MSDHDKNRFEKETFAHMSQLFRLAYARVGNVDDAHDIIQQTYIKAYRGFDRLKPGSNIKAWLNQILFNTVKDHFRKTGREPLIVSDEELLDRLDEAAELSEPGPEEIICRDEIDPELARALNSMPEQMAAPLLLRELSDASYGEIASILDIPVGTVMSRLSRARAYLRKRLNASGKQQYQSTAGKKESVYELQ